MPLTAFRIASAEYEREVAEGQALLDLAEDRINELQELIRAKYPAALFDVARFGPKDFRPNVFRNRLSCHGLHRVMKSRTTDILIDDDIWIVVIPHPLRELREN